MSNRRFPPMNRGAQAGFSLVELLISMVIGMVVVGAVLSAYLAAGSSGRNGRALAQITEDASIAMSVLRSNISMVGYGKATGVDPDGLFTKNYGGLGVFGCNGAFTDASRTIDQLACEAGDAPDSIAVAYEADRWNSVDSGGVPLDCLGNKITAAGGYYLAYNRFYVAGGQLLCRGPGSNAAQALVDNVEDMKIFYGVAGNTFARKGPATHRVAYFGSASVFNDLGRDVASNGLMSVRVCLVIRSADSVLDAPADYHGCSGDVKVDAGDRHLYRTFTSTIVLQNHVGAVL